MPFSAIAAMEVGSWSSKDSANAKFIAELSSFDDSRNDDGPLVLQLGQDEDRGERVEGAEDDQLLHVHSPVDERDQVALLSVQVEAIEIREEVGAQLRDGLQSARVGQERAGDAVADDLEVAAKREVVGIDLPGLDELGVGVPLAVLREGLADQPRSIRSGRRNGGDGHSARL